MNSSQKTSSRIFGFFNKLFTSQKPRKKRRVVFFVFLAVLVLGFSAKATFAKPSTPTPLPGATKAEVTAQGWTWPSSWVEQDATNKLPSDNNTFRYFLTQNGFTFSEANTEINKLIQDKKVESYVNSAQNTANVQTPPVGSSGEGFMETMLFAPIIAALYVIATFLKEFVGVAGNILDITLSSSLYNFTSNQMVVGGWIIVRDVCNLFFLLVLLFIAICTILKIEKYHAKKTLLMLIIMALLINFSKPIAIFIFDGSQLLMNMFLSKMGEGGNQSASTMYSNATGIANIVYNNVEKWKDSSSSGGLAVQYLFAIVFLFMLFVAYIVVALFLIIRVVAIILLIIVSPFAFFAAIVPDFSKMSSKWWSALFEYSYYGPAAAFFLYLGTSFSKYLPELTRDAGTSASLDILIKNIIHYLIILVFLYASIIMSKQFSIFASKSIVDNADKFMKWGAGMTKTGGLWGWGWRSGGFQGGLGQVAEQSKWTRWMTKRGRQRTQADRGAAIARVFGVKGAWFENFDKRSEEENKGLDYDSVNKKAQAGDERAALQSLKNGDGDDPLIFQTLMKTIKEHPEMRNHYRALYRKAGQFQLAAMLQELNPRDKHKNQIAVEINKEREEQHLPLYKDVKDALDKNTDLGKEVNNRLLKFYADEEVGRLGLSEIAKVDFHDFATNENVVPNKDARANLRKALYERLENLSEVKAEKYVDMASDTIGKNQTFFKRNTDFNKILQNAKTRAGVK